MCIRDRLETTGITATAGIGTNLFLCKVAMDIVAKHIPADKNGVRIAELDEMKFRRELWSHQPLTDFWRVGRGIAKKLEQNGMFTMGDVALCSEPVSYTHLDVYKRQARNHASSRFFRLLAFLFQFCAKPKPLSIASAEVSFEL